MLQELSDAREQRLSCRTTASNLPVFMAGEVVGDIAVEGSGGRLLYDSSARTPLSISMPLKPARHRDDVLISWLRNLLPDRGTVLMQRRRTFGVRAANPIDLLHHVGEDRPAAAGRRSVGAPRRHRPDNLWSSWIALTGTAQPVDGSVRSRKTCCRPWVSRRSASTKTRAVHGGPRELSRSIGTELEADKVARSDWSTLARDAGVDQEWVAEEIRRHAAVLPDAFSEAAGRLKGSPVVASDLPARPARHVGRWTKAALRQTKLDL